MKIYKFVFIFLALVAVLILGGCKFDIKYEMLNNLSDVRYNLFEAVTQEAKVTLMCGLREEPYEYNGLSNRKCEFGVITVNFINAQVADGFDFSLQAGQKEYKGKLERNPYQHNYMADIEALIGDDENVYLTINGVGSEMVLVCISKNWTVQYKNALEIATTHFETNAKQFFKNRKFNAECYLKIIYDENSDFETYLWYFGIVGTDSNRLSLVIDVNSGQILASSIE